VLGGGTWEFRGISDLCGLAAHTKMNLDVERDIRDWADHRTKADCVVQDLSRVELRCQLSAD
jgi:hypothetical protein